MMNKGAFERSRALVGDTMMIRIECEKAAPDGVAFIYVLKQLTWERLYCKM